MLREWIGGEEYQKADQGLFRLGAARAKAWKRQNRSLVYSAVCREVWLELRGCAGELMLERQSSKT